MQHVQTERDKLVVRARDRRAKARAEIANHRAQFEKEFGVDHLPDEVKSTIWNYAWDVGHANGFSEVKIHYEDYADLAKLAYKAGVLGTLCGTS